MTNGVPYARHRWNRISGGLHIGGHYYDPQQQLRALPVQVNYQFQFVLSLYADQKFAFGPPSSVRHLRFLIPDGILTAAEWTAVKATALQVANVLRTGRQVLVRCEAGYNRSGLVAGLVLLSQGRTAQQAIDLIRRKRSPHALYNPHFIELLHQEERNSHERSR